MTRPTPSRLSFRPICLYQTISGISSEAYGTIRIDRVTMKPRVAARVVEAGERVAGQRTDDHGEHDRDQSHDYRVEQVLGQTFLITEQGQVVGHAPALGLGRTGLRAERADDDPDQRADEDDGQQGLKDPGDDALPQWGSHNVLPPLSHLVLSRMPRIWMELMMTRATSTISESAAAIPRSFLESKAKL